MKIKYTLLAIIIIIGADVVGQGQGKIKKKVHKQKNEVVQKVEKHQKVGGEKFEEALGEIDATRKGNAFGKNKGGLTGKEFGQERAKQVHLARRSKAVDLSDVIIEKEGEVKKAKEQIKKANEKLEKKRLEDTVSESVYKEKRAKIKRAQSAVEELERKIEKRN